MLEIVYRWTCTVCGLAEECTRPKRWTWFRSQNGELGHRCEKCEKGRAPSEDKGTPLGTLSMSVEP